MNKLKLIATMCLTVTLCACAETKPDVKPDPNAPGGYRDAHGCIPSAGALWCQATQQCEAPWELAKKNHLEFSSTEDFDKFCNNQK